MPRQRVKGPSKRPTLRSKRHTEIPATARYVRATEVKNRFGEILDNVLQGRPAVITKHGDAKAILISVEEFTRLVSLPETELNVLRAEFDRLLKSMQGPDAKHAMQAAFDASPEELGRAAVRGVRRS